MRILKQVGSKKTILFNPEITMSEEGIITISSHTVYIREKKFELDTQTFNNPKSVWFNFENYTLEEKKLKPGAFRFLFKDEEGEYSVIRYVEYVESPQMVKTSVVKPKFWEKLRKLIWRK